MADLHIHHFDQLLKELENDMGRLNVLMDQAFIVVENVRRNHLMINETYENWCANVIKQ
jgi:hypothetical protein